MMEASVESEVVEEVLRIAVVADELGRTKLHKVPHFGDIGGAYLGGRSQPSALLRRLDLEPQSVWSLEVWLHPRHIL